MTIGRKQNEVAREFAGLRMCRGANLTGCEFDGVGFDKRTWSFAVIARVVWCKEDDAIGKSVSPNVCTGLDQRHSVRVGKSIFRAACLGAWDHLRSRLFVRDCLGPLQRAGPTS